MDREMIERMVGRIKTYAWGSVDAIPELLGVAPTGEPQAELWLGAHPLDPSTVAGTPLHDLLNDNPLEMLGSTSVETFGPRLPYLMKVFAAAQPLSLQTHPSRRQAEEIFRREEKSGVPVNAPSRVCRDTWPKPELLCALTETVALCGFRSPEQSYRLFHRLGAPAALEILAPLRCGNSRPLRAVLERTLLCADRPDVVADVVARSAEVLADPELADPELAELAHTAVELARFHPGDPGILAALLMNSVRLRPTEALFLPAGTLHAYVRGTGVEIMANSDNVLRAGLTRKHVDVGQLLAVLDFTPRAGKITAPVQLGVGLWAYPVPTPEFALWRLEVGNQGVELPGSGSGRVVLVTDGSATVTSALAVGHAAPPSDPRAVGLRLGGRSGGARPRRGRRLRRRTGSCAADAVAAA
jgi:mannose-6-phosphate isomerase